MRSIARVEKSTSDNIESLRVEMRSTQGELTSAMNEMQSKLDTLTPRVNKAQERVSDPENKLIERKEAKENRYRQLVAHEN